jgi:Hsp70 protein
MNQQKKVTLALLKFDEGASLNQYLVPTRVHISSKGVDEYKIGNEVNIPSSGPRYNKYWNFKADLMKSGAELKDRNNYEMLTTAAQVLTGSSKQKGMMPDVIAEKYLSRLCELVISNVRKALGENTQVRFSFTSPSDQSSSYKGYRERIRANINKIRKGLKGAEFASKEFMYEQLGVYYYYAACEPKINLSTSNATYLIIDIGGSTTDIAIIQTDSKGKLSRDIPTSESLRWGGTNYDLAIYEKLLGNDTLAEASERNNLLERIEELKLEILAKPTKKSVLNVQLEGNQTKPWHLDYTLLEEVFEKEWPKVSKEILGVILQVHNKGNRSVYNFKKFEKVLLAGGTARLPFISKQLLKDTDLKQYVHEEAIILPTTMNSSCLAAIGLATETVYRVMPDMTNKLLQRGQSVHFCLLDEQKRPLDIRRLGIEQDVTNLLFNLQELNGNRKKADKYWFMDEWPLTKGLKPDFTTIQPEPLPAELCFQVWSDVSPTTPLSISIPIKNVTPEQQELRLRISVDDTSQLTDLQNKKNLEEGGVVITLYPMMGQKRYEDRAQENKLRVPLVAEALKAKTDEVFVCIDFGMTNTCVAIYAPGKEELLKQNSNLFEVFDIDISSFEQVGDDVNTKENAKQSDGNLLPEIKDSGQGIEDEKVLGQLEKTDHSMANIDTHLNDIIAGLQLIGEAINNHNKVKPISKEVSWDEFKDASLKEFNPLPIRDDTNYTYSQFDNFLQEKNCLYSDSVKWSVWSQCLNPESRLIILAGPPGSGKTALVRLLNEFFNQDISDRDIQNQTYCLQAVSPSWFSPENLLGGYSEFDMKFHGTKFLKFLMLAEENSSNSRTFFACLDEFNIAQPEMYFSSILSSMEADKRLSVCQDISSAVIILPKSLKIFATINTDFSSKFLSPKVLDRATYIRVKPSCEDLKYHLHKCDDLDASGKKIIDHLIQHYEELYNLAEISQTPLGFRLNEQVKSFIQFHPLIYDIKENVKLDTYKDTDLNHPFNRILDGIISNFFLSRLTGAYNVDNEKGYKQALEKSLKSFSSFVNSKEVITKISKGLPGQSAL